MIRYLDTRRIWVLEGATVAYALGITPTGLLVHTYFGGPLPQDSDYPTPEDFPVYVPFSGLDENSGEEYPAWGGLRYVEPCLKISFADGARDVVLKYQDSIISQDELTIRMSDPQRAIDVALSYRIDEENGIVERSARIANAGSEPVVIEEAMSGALTLPSASDYRLSSLTGRWGAETQLRRTMVGNGTHVLESRRGHTSHGANPWCALDRDGMATEETGEVYALALAYSGNWKAVVQVTQVGQVRITAGVHDFDFAWQLGPGEVFETPALLFTRSDGGFGGVSRNLHGHIRTRVLPSNHRDEPRPILYNSWEATMFNVNAQNQIELAERAAELGVELFVIDDGWFGARNSDTAGLGDWRVNTEKFPDGLGAVAKRIHELGMKFGLWVEPEMVNPDSDLYREHPEWTYQFPNRESSQMRNQLVLNLGRSDVQEFVFGFMHQLLSDTQIDFIKWDMNRPFSEPGGPGMPADRQKEIWFRHVQGLYRVMARIRAEHPTVLFEDCSGGGGRIDAGILRYFDQAWISDNTDALDRLFIQEGYSQLYPANTMVAWVTAPESILEQRDVPLQFRFHSAMTGVLGIGDNILRWSAEERALARRLIAEYKEIRPIVQRGSQYRLLSPRDHGMSSVLYVSEDRSEAVLFAFLNRNHFRNRLPPIRLAGLDRTASYEITTDPPRRLSGEALHRIGLQLDMTREYQSTLIRLHRV